MVRGTSGGYLGFGKFCLRCLMKKCGFLPDGFADGAFAKVKSPDGFVRRITGRWSGYHRFLFEPGFGLSKKTSFHNQLFFQGGILLGP